MWEITTHKIRARYYDVSYHGVRKCVIESTDIESYLLDISADDKLDLYFNRNWYWDFDEGFHCVILDLKDLVSHLFEE